MDKDLTQLPELELNALAATLVDKVKAYFDDVSHRTAFEEWYEKKYGYPYIWKS